MFLHHMVHGEFPDGLLGGFSSKSILPPEIFSLMRMGIPRLTHAFWAVCSFIIRIGQGMHTSFEVHFINSLNQSPSLSRCKCTLGYVFRQFTCPLSWQRWNRKTRGSLTAITGDPLLSTAIFRNSEKTRGGARRSIMTNNEVAKMVDDGDDVSGS